MRTEYCGTTDTRYLGKTVTLFGWAHRRRDHGGVIFIDLRDREGLVQVVCDPDRADTFATADRVRNEFVLRVQGVVRRRPEGTVNAELKSGEIEVLAHEIEVLNAAATPPFLMDDEQISEEVRLKYRYLDLRRPAMQRIMRMRHATARAVREYLDDNGFIDVETPVLYKSTPEGAREFLVPSRIHDGQFYALPQSPQLFKQILMVAGYDRYYQIVKCFRDEDLRADRQPEFTQIDVETSFLTEREIQDLMEGLVRHVWKRVLDVDLPPFPRLTYAEATSRYGSDKPDLRVKLELTELTDAVRDCGFKVFKSAAELKDGRVAALRVPGGNEQFTRKELDDLTPFVAIYGAKGLAYIRVNDPSKLNEEGLQSPIVKFLSPEVLGAILERTGARAGDVIFFGADRRKVVNDALGALRNKIGHEKGHADKGAWRPLWVLDFPAFEYDEEHKRWAAAHHPFTSPKDEHVALLETDPGKVLAKAYDIALNGWELGGGSVRIHRADIQAKQFATLGIGEEAQRAKFGWLLDALAYGAPPHGGIAFGLDRMVAMLAGVDQIRDVMAFPKTQRGQDLMVDTPTPVTEKQPRDLHIQLRNPVRVTGGTATWVNALARLFGTGLPIVQAPMAGVQAGALAAAACQAGALGSLPCAMLTVEAMRAELDLIRSRTDRPFNVNFFCHQPPEPDPRREAQWRELLAPYYAEFGIDASTIPAGAGRIPFTAAAADALERFRPAVVSFHFGLPAADLVARVKSWGSKVMSSATTVEEARWLEAHGVDAVIAQGVEAGGHRGMFLGSDVATQLGTFALVPQVVAAVRVPVIAAGGIADASGVRAAMALGASGVQVGTAFLLCPEATTPAVNREALRRRPHATTLTNLFTGRPSRGIVNRLVREIGPINACAPAFPLATAAIAPLRAKAEAAGSGDFSPLWSGQNASGCREVPAAQIVQELARGLEDPR